MEYQGYSAKIEYDENLGAFHGQVLNINDVITFQGTSVEALRREFAASVDDYLAWCEERGELPEKPYSGRFLLRVDPDLHRQVALAAARDGVSLNAWVAGALEGAVSAEAAGRDAPATGRSARAPLLR